MDVFRPSLLYTTFDVPELIDIDFEWGVIVVFVLRFPWPRKPIDIYELLFKWAKFVSYPLDISFENVVFYVSLLPPRIFVGIKHWSSTWCKQLVRVAGAVGHLREFVPFFAVQFAAARFRPIASPLFKEKWNTLVDALIPYWPSPWKSHWAST